MVTSLLNCCHMADGYYLRPTELHLQPLSLSPPALLYLIFLNHSLSLFLSPTSPAKMSFWIFLSLCPVITMSEARQAGREMKKKNHPGFQTLLSVVTSPWFPNSLFSTFCWQGRIKSTDSGESHHGCTLTVWEPDVSWPKIFFSKIQPSIWQPFRSESSVLAAPVHCQRNDAWLNWLIWAINKANIFYSVCGLD